MSKGGCCLLRVTAAFHQALLMAAVETFVGHVEEEAVSTEQAAAIVSGENPRCLND